MLGANILKDFCLAILFLLFFSRFPLWFWVWGFWGFWGFPHLPSIFDIGSTCKKGDEGESLSIGKSRARTPNLEVSPNWAVPTRTRKKVRTHPTPLAPSKPQADTSAGSWASPPIPFSWSSPSLSLSTIMAVTVIGVVLNPGYDAQSAIAGRLEARNCAWKWHKTDGGLLMTRCLIY